MRRGELLRTASRSVCVSVPTPVFRSLSTADTLSLYSSHCHRAGGWGEGGGGLGGGDVRACVCVCACVSGVWTRLFWNDRHLLRPIKSHPKDLERLILFFSFGNPPTLLIASPDLLLSSNAAVDTPVRSRFCFGFCLAAVSATVLFVIAGKTNYLISDPDHDVGSSLFRGYNVTDRRHQWNTPQCSFSNTTKVSCFASRVSLCKYPPLRGTAYKVWLCWCEEGKKLEQCTIFRATHFTSQSAHRYSALCFLFVDWRESMKRAGESTRTKRYWFAIRVRRKLDRNWNYWRISVRTILDTASRCLKGWFI